jgi:O-antigen ligase
VQSRSRGVPDQEFGPAPFDSVEKPAALREPSKRLVSGAKARLRLDGVAFSGFVLSAAIGVWAAYDRPSAAARFLAIVAAVVVHYGLARCSLRDLWKVATLCSLLCILLAATVFLGVFLGGGTADLEAGGIASDFRRLLSVDSETSVGLLTILFPFQVAAAVYPRQRERASWAGWLAACVLSVGALLVAGSAGAIVALLLVAGVMSWRAITARSLGRLGWSLAGGGLAGLLAVLAALAMSSGPAGLWSMLASRIDVARAALWLAQDFRFTGGGLGSFPGLYSRYILMGPFLYYRQSYNLFLDLTVEQGLLGLSCYLAVFVGAVWHLGRPQPVDERGSRRIRLLRHATMASLLAGFLFGMVHDPFRSPLGTAFLFMGPGFAAALERRSESNAAVSSDARIVSVHRTTPRVSASMVALAVSVLVLIGGSWPWRDLPANLAADVGAVRLAQAELQGWPSSGGPRVPTGAPLATVQRWLGTALELDPGNRAANHRLGLIAMQMGDFSAASGYLQAAWERGQGHRGIRKALGYSYVWLGEFDRAEELLLPISEAAWELRWYARWWEARGQHDLAALSAVMSGRLEKAG